MPKGFLVVLAMAGALSAQPLRSPTSFPWWNNPVANGLNNLTDAQTKQINATKSEYRDALKDLYAQVNAAESNLEEIFIIRIRSTSAKPIKLSINSPMRAAISPRTLSQMSLKLRNVLTAEQWRDLQDRQRGRGAPRPGPRRRGTDPVSKNAPSSAPPAGAAAKAAPNTSISK